MARQIIVIANTRSAEDLLSLFSFLRTRMFEARASYSLIVCSCKRNSLTGCGVKSILTYFPLTEKKTNGSSPFLAEASLMIAKLSSLCAIQKFRFESRASNQSDA